MTSEDKTTFDSALEMIIESMKKNISNELFWQTEMQDIGFGINCNVIEYKDKIKSILTMYFCNITAVDRAIRLPYFLHEISMIHLGNNDFAKYYVYKMLNLYKDNVHISMLKPIINDYLSKYNLDILETKYTQSLNVINAIYTNTLISFKVIERITFENRESMFNEIFDLDEETAQTIFCKTK